MAKTRRVFQILFLLFFVVLFINARYPYSGSLPSDIFLRFSPLIPLFDFIQNLRISLLFWPALIILVLTVFLGRIFCGWICPLGTTLDITSCFIKSPPNKKALRFQKLRSLKFIVLFALMALAIFSIHLWGFLDPLSIFNRVLTVVFYPFATLAVETGMLATSEISFLEEPTYWLYDQFKAIIMPENQAFLHQVFWVALFVGGILAMEKLSRRFWCRNICPAGAFLGLLSQFRFYERIVGDACPVCNKCQTECKMNAIPEGDLKKTSKIECIESFNCGINCPPKISAITYRWRWKPYRSKPDYSRRHFVQTAFGSVAALGLISIGLKNRSQKHQTIRPPGAVEEDLFLDRCIRCMECVRMCQSNGACLQPGGIHSSLLELWAPVAVMRTGYCEFNCSLCGEVCPTDAILPLPLEVKQLTPMGLAYFDKDICIPYAQNTDCLVCEEHCPTTPEKAIQFQIKEAVLKDGSTSLVKYPYVTKELCIGCGICENKCPLPGAPGVYVTRENEKRLDPVSLREESA